MVWKKRTVRVYGLVSLCKHRVVKDRFALRKDCSHGKDVWGYWKAVVEGTREMPSYFYRINDEKDRPDPRHTTNQKACMARHG